MVGIGSVLVYAGIKGYSVLAVLQNLITGKPITTNLSIANPLGGGGEDTEFTGDGMISRIPAGGNKALGQSMAINYGWSGAEWEALDKLWTRESSWNNRADNPTSHAYGIPQALPHTKMPKIAWPESAGGMSDATAQISWGLAYIKQRYGTPRMAWAHSEQTGWY